MSSSYSAIRRTLLRWRLAGDIVAWSIPAAIVGAAIVLLAWLSWEELR